MANVHVQEAAHNLKRAMNDMQDQIVQSKPENSQEVRQIESRINEIKKEEVKVRASSVLTDSDQAKAMQISQLQDLERELSSLNRELIRVKDELKRNQSEFERQKAEFNRIANMLDAMA